MSLTSKHHDFHDACVTIAIGIAEKTTPDRDLTILGPCNQILVRCVLQLYVAQG